MSDSPYPQATAERAERRAPLEALVNAIACQQLSLTVGIHLLNRLTAAYGRPVPGDAGAAV